MRRVSGLKAVVAPHGSESAMGPACRFPPSAGISSQSRTYTTVFAARTLQCVYTYRQTDDDATGEIGGGGYGARGIWTKVAHETSKGARHLFTHLITASGDYFGMALH